MRNLLILLLFSILVSSFGMFESLKGTWASGKGQTIVFGKENHCKWIFDMEGIKDTFDINYHYEKTGKQTGILDLGPFTRGYLKGKTLFGIVEWGSKKNSFSYDAEPGKQASVRPQAFDPADVQLYQKVK